MAKIAQELQTDTDIISKKYDTSIRYAKLKTVTTAPIAIGDILEQDNGQLVVALDGAPIGVSTVRGIVSLATVKASKVSPTAEQNRLLRNQYVYVE